MSSPDREKERELLRKIDGPVKKRDKKVRSQNKSTDDCLSYI